MLLFTTLFVYFMFFIWMFTPCFPVYSNDRAGFTVLLLSTDWSKQWSGPLCCCRVWRHRCERGGDGDRKNQQTAFRVFVLSHAGLHSLNCLFIVFVVVVVVFCMCVRAHARARVCLCVCVRERAHVRERTHFSWYMLGFTHKCIFVENNWCNVWAKIQILLMCCIQEIHCAMFFLCTKNDLFDILSKMLHLTVFFIKDTNYERKRFFPSPRGLSVKQCVCVK